MSLEELRTLRKLVLFGDSGIRQTAIMIINREIKLKELEKNPTGPEHALDDRISER